MKNGLLLLSQKNDIVSDFQKHNIKIQLLISDEKIKGRKRNENAKDWTSYNVLFQVKISNNNHKITIRFTPEIRQQQRLNNSNQAGKKRSERDKQRKVEQEGENREERRQK